jgi:hypothetical protein
MSGLTRRYNGPGPLPRLLVGATKVSGTVLGPNLALQQTRPAAGDKGVGPNLALQRTRPAAALSGIIRATLGGPVR